MKAVSAETHPSTSPDAKPPSGPPDAVGLPTPGRIPPAFLGHYVVRLGKLEETGRLVVIDVGPGDVVSAPRTIFESADESAGLPFVSVRGDRIAFTGILSIEQAQNIYVSTFVDPSPVSIAQCEFACGLMGVGADDELWFVDYATSSSSGQIAHVPLAGGTKVHWPHAFADCALTPIVSEDGQRLLLGVDNFVGRPECRKGSYQGVYVIPIGDHARRDLAPKRSPCLNAKATTNADLVISHLDFDGPDRMVLAVNPGWEADAAVEPNGTWSYLLDGSERRAASGEKQVPRVRTIGGQDFLVVGSEDEDSEDAGKDLIRILGPFPSIFGFAFHR